MENFLNGICFLLYFCENFWFYVNRINIYVVFVCYVWSVCVDMMWYVGYVSKCGW